MAGLQFRYQLLSTLAKAVRTVTESRFGTAENYLHVIKHGETKELALLTLILTKIETKLVASI